MKKKLATSLLAGALSASMVIPAFATAPATGDGSVTTADTGTEVWAGIVIQDKDPVVKVEVPTLFAFVVNGTVDTGDHTPISKADGTLYLPNVKVEVTSPSTTTAEGSYKLNYTSDGVMRLNNYSTYGEEDTSTGTSLTIRKGLPLTINGEIRETSATASAKNYWEYSTTATTGNRDDFKKYQISIEGIGLTVGTSSSATTKGYKMEKDIALEAPDTQWSIDTTTGTPTVTYTNMDTATFLASTPTTLEANFDVIIGGQRDQYSQVEQSAKIGTIVWTVSADASVYGKGVETAPNNDYLK